MMTLLQKTNRSQRRRNPVEQRCCPRFPFSPAVEAVDIQANTKVMGRLSDIARHGCYMDTISPFAVKAAVTLMITRDNQSFTTQATVVYSQIGMGMGLFFTTAEPEQLRMLETWLAELGSGEKHQPTSPTADPQPDIAKTADPELRGVLREMIILLNRKNILGDAESETLLRKLSK
jgi:PilZ domain-containing protein